AAAKRLEPLDAGLARDSFLEALGAAMFAGRLSGAVGVREVADAARTAARAGASLESPRGVDLLLDGLVTRFTEGYPAGVAPLRRALRTLQALLREYGLVGREVRFAFGVSPELWDDEAWHELASLGVRVARDAGAVLYNGLGRYRLALGAAQRACAYEDLGVYGWALVELIEAGARSGTREVAAAALERLTERTRASATDWALGIEARSRALLSDSQTAELLYRESIEHLGRSRIAVHLARAH